VVFRVAEEVPKPCGRSGFATSSIRRAGFRRVPMRRVLAGCPCDREGLRDETPHHLSSTVGLMLAPDSGNKERTRTY